MADEEAADDHTILTNDELGQAVADAASRGNALGQELGNTLGRELGEKIVSVVSEAVSKPVSKAVSNAVVDLCINVKQLAKENAWLKEKLQGKTYGPFLQRECAICLEPLYKKKVSYFPCNHHFHFSCGDMWLRRETWCPICRNTTG